MKKSGLLSKYEHQLTLKNYSVNTLKAYLNGLNVFLEYELNQQTLSLCDGADLEPGDTFILKTPGGGGFGKR